MLISQVAPEVLGQIYRLGAHLMFISNERTGWLSPKCCCGYLNAINLSTLAQSYTNEHCMVHIRALKIYVKMHVDKIGLSYEYYYLSNFSVASATIIRVLLILSDLRNGKHLSFNNSMCIQYEQLELK